MVAVIEESQLRNLVGIGTDELNIIEKSFTWLANGQVDMPPIMHMSVPSNNGDVDIKSAYVEGLDNLTVKIGAGFFNNHLVNLPSSSSSMVVVSTETGFTEAILLENGYLTNLRTGMAGAVTAKHLALESVKTVAIIGAGAQGRFQLECLKLVRDFSQVVIYSRQTKMSEIYAAEMKEKLGVEVSVCTSAEEAVKQSQIVITTTPSTQAIVQGEWLQPGTHVIAMGTDLSGKQELSLDCFEKATLFACDSKKQCQSNGELQHCTEAQQQLSKVVELADVITGKIAYQRNANDITICDLTGMGVQDTAIANLTMTKYKALAK